MIFCKNNKNHLKIKIFSEDAKNKKGAWEKIIFCVRAGYSFVPLFLF